jgi:CubicO group peptidase (beta-lactamase class C family)
MLRIAFLCLLFLSPAGAQPIEQRRTDLERIVTQAMARDRIPAISVAVATPDDAVWAGAWGLADLENFVPATARTAFRLASVSKPFTAAAALILAQEGRLDLDAPIQKYIPEFPQKQWPVTARQLLGHLGGIRHYAADEFNSTKHYWNLAEGLKIFAGDPLLHEPGTKFEYTSYGFNLAGAVVEAAAGQPFAEFVRRRILEPSGSPSMQPDDVYTLVPSRARGYRRRPDGEIENCALADTSNKIPGGGWVATASDVARFGQALMAGKLLRPETLETMWTPQRLKDGRSTGYGLGWGLKRSGEVRIVEHAGGQQGASTFVVMAPEKQVAVVVLTNLEGAPADLIAREILSLALEAAR